MALLVKALALRAALALISCRSPWNWLDPAFVTMVMVVVRAYSALVLIESTLNSW